MYIKFLSSVIVAIQEKFEWFYDLILKIYTGSEFLWFYEKSNISNFFPFFFNVFFCFWGT